MRKISIDRKNLVKRIAMSFFGVIICAISVGIFKIAAFWASTPSSRLWRVLAGGGFLKIPTIAGVGTIITAFFMGPLIEFFNEKIALPFLNTSRV